MNKTWSSGLHTLLAANDTLLALEMVQTNVGNGEPPNIGPFVANLEALASHAQVFASKLGPRGDQLTSISTVLADTLPILKHFAEGEKTLLILLQNSDELRATGGFMGSYVLLHFNSGNLGEIVVEDIYDADGQVKEYFEPPSGVEEFLSGGKGWRLPDANWHADFALSSQDALRFFALANRSHIDGVVAINLPLVKSILAISGPIQLIDQDKVLSEANVSQVLRADRDSFFAGSTAKKDTLSQAITQLKLAVVKLSLEEKKQLLEQLRQHVLQGNILAYFPRQELQSLAQSLNLSGRLGPPILEPDTHFYYPLESNVGINKVNAQVRREYVMTVSDTLTELGITLHNDSSQDGYVNYQRLLYSPGQTIEQIVVNGEQITTFDSESITSSSGQVFEQIGFLVTTLPNNTTRIAITLSHPANFSKIMLQKQPGTAETTLTTISATGAKNHQLTKSFLEYVIE